VGSAKQFPTAGGSRTEKYNQFLAGIVLQTPNEVKCDL